MIALQPASHFFLPVVELPFRFGLPERFDDGLPNGDDEDCDSQASGIHFCSELASQILVCVPVVSAPFESGRRLRPFHHSPDVGTGPE